jgi:ABC-type polysaccharide/polyol phosphate transport system ATPase subunit
VENLVSQEPGQPIVQLEDITVRYRLPNERIPSLKEYVVRWLRRQINYHNFWALQGVSLSMHRGEVVGIIGHNGAGKSTLLKIIAQVLCPSLGRVCVRGRVVPLLELGAGFDLELTGRENTFLNSAILGHSYRDTLARFEGIVEFSGLREFIDAPLRTYSTGMVVRLAFAIATDTQPEILLVDEILSVGDAEFREKSGERIANFRKNGATILVVSHNLDVVESMCDRVAWLNHGRLSAVGPTLEVIGKYQQGSTNEPEHSNQPRLSAS